MLMLSAAWLVLAFVLVIMYIDHRNEKKQKKIQK